MFILVFVKRKYVAIYLQKVRKFVSRNFNLIRNSFEVCASKGMFFLFYLLLLTYFNGSVLVWQFRALRNNFIIGVMQSVIYLTREDRIKYKFAENFLFLGLLVIRL